MAKHKVDIVGVNTSDINVLTNQEILELLSNYRKGDTKCKEEIILGNLKLVLSVIKNFSSRHDNQDDLFQIGTIGLIKAIDTGKVDSYGKKIYYSFVEDYDLANG